MTPEARTPYYPARSEIRKADETRAHTHTAEGNGALRRQKEKEKGERVALRRRHSVSRRRNASVAGETQRLGLLLFLSLMLFKFSTICFCLSTTSLLNTFFNKFSPPLDQLDLFRKLISNVWLRLIHIFPYTKLL